MFTGIIQAQAVLKNIQRRKNGVELTFEKVGTNTRFRKGESVAVDGTCLTVTRSKGKKFTVDVIPETLQATTLGRLEPGERVNIERSLKFGDRIGGHWVTGHVDGVGRIRQLEPRGKGLALEISAPQKIMNSLIQKGSIAVDGISFTVQKVGTRTFRLGVIPETVRATTLRWKKIGDGVNLETDLLAKLVQRSLSTRRSALVQEKKLRQQGF